MGNLAILTGHFPLILFPFIYVGMVLVITWGMNAAGLPRARLSH